VHDIVGASGKVALLDLEAIADAMEEEDMTIQGLSDLTDDELTELGVHKIGSRRALVAKAKQHLEDKAKQHLAPAPA